jgi:hypothetical protein
MKRFSAAGCAPTGIHHIPAEAGCEQCVGDPARQLTDLLEAERTLVLEVGNAVRVDPPGPGRRSR